MICEMTDMQVTVLNSSPSPGTDSGEVSDSFPCEPLSLKSYPARSSLLLQLPVRDSGNFLEVFCSLILPTPLSTGSLILQRTLQVAKHDFPLQKLCCFFSRYYSSLRILQYGFSHLARYGTQTVFVVPLLIVLSSSEKI